MKTRNETKDLSLRHACFRQMRLSELRKAFTEKSVGWPSAPCRIRSADFQSAVSQVCNLRAVRPSNRTGTSEQAGHSELTQIENLRYSRLQTCATPKASACSLSPRPDSKRGGHHSPVATISYPSTKARKHP